MTCSCRLFPLSGCVILLRSSLRLPLGTPLGDRRGRARIPFEELPPQTQLEGTECCVSMLLRAQILDGKCPAEFQLELSASFREEATPHLSSLQACPLGPRRATEYVLQAGPCPHNPPT